MKKKGTGTQGKPLPYLRLESIGRAGWLRADRRLERIGGWSDLAAVQAELNRIFEEIFGPRPDPAAPVPFRELAGFSFAGVEIRQVLLEPEPGYRISGFTFRSGSGSGPGPALVVASGHVERAALYLPYLKLCLYAAQNGFYVLAFDPVGQGSRREVFLPGADPEYWSPCDQHQELAAVAMLTGRQLAHYLVRDNTSAISFVASRPEVDPERIGFTGQSGGGIQTFLALADSRVRAAVPMQATSSRRGAFQHLVMRDMDQIFWHCWERGFDQSELVALFAPRPVRIIAEHGYPDQVDIYRRLEPVYRKLGLPEQLEIASTSLVHNLNRPARELVLNWFSRHLAGGRPPELEPVWTGLEDFWPELRAAQDGLDLRDYGLVSRTRREAAERAGSLSGRPAALRAVPFLKRGTRAGRPAAGTGSSVNRRPAWLAPGYRVPFRLAAGRRPAGPTLLIVDQAGSGSAWSRAWLKSAPALSGRAAALDVFNCGRLKSDRPENQSDYFKIRGCYYSSAVYHFSDALMAGTCPIDLALEEIRSVLTVLGPERPLALAGRGWPALALLLLSALHPGVEWCCLDGLPASWTVQLKAGRMRLGYDYLVPGVLNHTDIPALIEANRRTRYFLTGLIEPELAGVDYRDRGRFPNVVLLDRATQARLAGRL